MSKKIKRSNNLLQYNKNVVVIALVIFGFLIVFLWNKSNVSINNAESTNDVQALTPYQATNWKTYSNNAIGYEINYPPNFLPPHIPGAYESPPADGTENEGFIFFTRNKPSLSYLLDVHLYNSSLDDFYSNFQKGETATNNLGEFNRSVELHKTITIDNIPAKWVTVKTIKKKDGIESDRSNVILLVSKNHSFKFMVYTSEKSPDTNELILQIISTLRFTE